MDGTDDDSPAGTPNSAGKAALGRNPKAAAGAALARTSVGKAAAPLTGPAVSGARATTTHVAKAAIKGAATGGAAGAVKGAAVGLVRTKLGRRILIALAALVLVNTIAMPVLGMLVIAGLSSALGGGDKQQSAAAVSSAGVSDETASEVYNVAATSGIPWPILLAVRDQEGKMPDLTKLRTSLGSAAQGFGAGTAHVEGKGMVPGGTAQQKADATAERARYVKGLVTYGMDEQTAETVYDTALNWYMGQGNSCGSDINTASAPKDETPNPSVPNASNSVVSIPFPGGTKKLSAAQVNNAITIIQVSKTVQGVGEDGTTIALMTALVESNLKNYANRNVPDSLSLPNEAIGADHDSLGLFQQRVFWGRGDGDAAKVAWLMNTTNQTKAFLGGPDGPNHGSPRGLLDVFGWDARPKGEAAQAVQVSAFPDRYQAQEALATAIYNKYQGQTTAGGCDSSDSSSAVNGSGGANPVGDPKWPISSGFGPRLGNAIASSNHMGIDFGGAPEYCGMPIYAVADGTVEQVYKHPGFGNLVTIDHGSFESYYAHQMDGSEKWWPKPGQHVKAGQLIGRIGMTGHALGCHLHLEIHVGGKPVDPAHFLTTQLGVPLKYWTVDSNGKPSGVTVVPDYAFHPDLSKKLR